MKYLDGHLDFYYFKITRVPPLKTFQGISLETGGATRHVATHNLRCCCSSNCCSASVVPMNTDQAAFI